MSLHGAQSKDWIEIIIKKKKRKKKYLQVCKFPKQKIQTALQFGGEKNPTLKTADSLCLFAGKLDWVQMQGDKITAPTFYLAQNFAGIPPEAGTGASKS